ncbi:TPA: ribosome silencing factor [Legionella pneumophila]|nr:ribosome silencing factor [Legionella pneumophila]
MLEKNPTLEKLLKSLEDIQAIDIKIIDVHKQTTITDFMVVTSGRSFRHVKSIAQKVLEDMKVAGLPCLSSTGIEHGDWALIDFGDIILHVMQPEFRHFYNLEGLWEEHPGNS